MRLRNKTISILAACWVVGLAVIYFLSISVLQSRFEQLESAYVRGNMHRAENALQDKYNQMAEQTIPVKGTDLRGQFYNLDTNKLEPIPKQLMDVAKGKIYQLRGITKINDQYWLVLQRENGLFVSQQLSRIMLSQMEKMLQLPLNIEPITELMKTRGGRLILTEFKERSLVHLPASGRFEGFVALRDVYGDLRAVITVDMPINIHSQAEKAIVYYLVLLFLLAIVITLVVIWLLERFILTRLESVSTQVTEIDPAQQMNRRVVMPGNDELSDMTESVNGMLDIIEKTHSNLQSKFQKSIGELRDSKAQLVEKQEKLDFISHYDPLTKLPNRILFNELLLGVIENSRANNKKFALLYLDVDRFKNVNDVVGHSVGDSVLSKIAVRIKEAVGNDSIVARLSGDEFLICTPSINEAVDAGKIAEKLRNVFIDEFMIGERKFHLTVSIGISIFPQDGDSIEKLQSSADMARYRAKHEGGNSYQFFTKNLNINVTKKLEIEHALRQAIEEEQLTVYFQPIVDVATKTVNSAEALIRWQHPVYGIIPPDEFINIAEETGLIFLVSEAALKSAVKFQREWKHKYNRNIHLAVNYSGLQFNDKSMVPRLKELINSGVISPEELTIEITESSIMKNFDSTVEKIKQLRDLGFSLSIDDFGTGYSSLSYLKKFNANYLKIDKSFVHDVETSKGDQQIISAIVGLGHSMEMGIVAEGVETARQFDFLVQIKCDFIQGYLFSAPLPADKFIEKYRQAELI